MFYCSKAEMAIVDYMYFPSRGNERLNRNKNIKILLWNLNSKDWTLNEGEIPKISWCILNDSAFPQWKESNAPSLATPLLKSFWQKNVKKMKNKCEKTRKFIFLENLKYRKLKSFFPFWTYSYFLNRFESTLIIKLSK